MKLQVINPEGDINFQTQFYGKSAERFHSLPQMPAWWWRCEGGPGISHGAVEMSASSNEIHEWAHQG